MAFELARLEESGARPNVDQALLSHGVVAVDLVWTVDGDEVPLTAHYPDGFPRMRPSVRLRGDPTLFPERHCNPVDGNLCLLGRDTAQWLPSWTLARLLSEQLEHALRGTGEEDPQGEPAEVWWNGFGLVDSYVLIDSEWEVGEAREGSLTLRYVAKGGQSPQIQAAVTEVRDASRATIGAWSEPLPEHLRRGRSAAVPWVRVDGAFLPHGPDAPEIQSLLKQHPRLCRPGELATGLYGFFFGVVYQMEVALGQAGRGWLIGLVHGPRKAFGPKAKRPQQFNTVQTMRAGRQDIGGRVPAVAILREKKIALFGVGAIGGPLALELARNGCNELRVLDPDVVEPGNSIRWPLGSVAWGRRKVDVLHEFILANYPHCVSVPYPHALGKDPGDDRVLERMLDGVDIAIDASAAYGVTTLLYDYTSERGIQLVSLWATPPATGGVVARYVPGSGCPVCLEHHHNEDSISPPPGLGDETSLLQPPGCAERTFPGGSFDLQELSLESLRVVIDAVSSTALESRVETLSLVADGQRTPPVWRVDTLPKHAACSCR
jgi:hypothetical protein